MKKNKKGTVSRIFKMASLSKGAYTGGVTFSVLGIVTSVIPFFSIYFIVNHLLTSAVNNTQISFGIVRFWAWITVGGVIVGLFCILLGSYICHRIAFKVLFGLRMKILNHMGELDLGFYTGNSNGSLHKIMDKNVEKIEGFIAHIFSDVIGASVVLIFLFIFMFSINVLLAGLTLLLIIIAFAIQFSVFGGEKGKSLISALNNSESKMNADFAEYTAGMEEQKIFGNNEKTSGKVSETVKDYGKWTVQSFIRISFVFSSYRTIIMSLITFILGYATIALLNFSTETSFIIEILMFMIVVPAIQSPLHELVDVGADIRVVSVLMDEIDQILDMKKIPQPKEGKNPRNFTVKFDDVSFSYQDNSEEVRIMALKNLSITIPQGKMTALIGPSGGGKSTIGQLVSRFWDVEQGRITIGGMNIKDIRSNALMDLIAFVFQDTHIFSATVYENLSMNKDFAHEQVINAAKAAQCHNFIEQLPEGYKTELGDGGHTLSGGEAQRIAIARAILKNAPIVILDEAMAFTDAENEWLIRKAMGELLKDKTVLIVAHRLYSIMGVDNIIVIDQGKAVEQGTHQGLLEKQGLYTHLWNIQNSSLNWSLKQGREII